jgi:hypothetical protein
MNKKGLINHFSIKNWKFDTKKMFIGIIFYYYVNSVQWDCY